MTGQSVMNGTWLRCDPNGTGARELVWRRLTGRTKSRWRHGAIRASRLPTAPPAAHPDGERDVRNHTGPAAGAASAPQRHWSSNIQYVKDLSFEVPGAPQIYTQLRSPAQVNINLDVQARRVAGRADAVRGRR